MSKFPALVREHVKEELHGTYTIALAIVEDIDEANRRVEVSLKDDEGVLVDNVPVATSYAGDGYGEIYPITPGETEGLLLVNKEPINQQIQQRGPVDIDHQRQHSYQDSFFFPQFWFDEDSVPDHNPGDYLLSHESGTLVWIKEDGSYSVESDIGTIELDNDPDPDADLEQEYNIEWPDDRLRVSHHSGIELEFTNDGFNVSTAEDDYRERPEDTVSSHGSLTDPHRIEMQDHRHLIPAAGGGGYLLSGPPLSNRLLFDIFLGTDFNSNIQNYSHQWFADEQVVWEDYLSWLESETGETLEPTMPRDGDDYPQYEQDQWVDVEPIPDAEERSTWGEN